MVLLLQVTLEIQRKITFRWYRWRLVPAKCQINGLYGDGRFSYSVNDVTDSVAVGDLTLSSESWEDVGFDSVSKSVGDGTLANPIRYNQS